MIKTVKKIKTFFLIDENSKPSIRATFLCLLNLVASSDKMGKVVAGRAFGIKLFCQNKQMHNHYQSLSDQSWPGSPTTASNVAQQSTCGNYATAKHSEIRAEREEEGK